jgi:hypothetical protein
MKVKDMIPMLQKANPEADVRAFNGDSEQFESVTGMTYGGESMGVDLKIVDLYTDEP